MKSVLNDLYRIIASLPSRRRKQLIPLLFLMLLSGVAEVLSLAILIPFLGILADPNQIMQRPYVATVVSMFHLDASADIRWQLTVLFCFAAGAAGLIRFAMIFFTTKLNFIIGHEIGVELYRRTLCQPYEIHISRNSNEVTAAIDKTDNVVIIIESMLLICSSTLMALLITATLLYIDPLIAGVALFGFGSFYIVFSLITKSSLARNSRAISTAYGTRLQAVQEGLGGVQDVILDHVHGPFIARFEETDGQLRKGQASNSIIGPSPRVAIEAMGIVLIAMLGYYMTSTRGGIAEAIPILGALALGAQRLMPLLQHIYQAWVYISGNRDVLRDVLDLLEQPVPDGMHDEAQKISFQRTLRLENIAFRYRSDTPFILQDLNITIHKGERIGIVGSTGSGKSTAMDILLGLLQPTCGRIIVDDVTPLTEANRSGWQRNIAHVPQAVFLTDASFAENIAFGVPLMNIDHNRVREAAIKAQIAEFIESTPDKYWTTVGERGVRLSGGQRQRIGIARALYKRATILVFDEATSALDGETELAVMQAIENLGSDLTIVMIAHRITTLRKCDVIYTFENGRVYSAGQYETLIKAHVA
jgi:ABC-type multidrug transport system fused ATPase/permease subunit